MHKLIVSILLSFFSLSCANDSAKIEDLKKRFAEYRQENKKATKEEEEAIATGVAAIIIPPAFGFIMNLGLKDRDFMQQRLNGLPYSWWTNIACLALDAGILIYAAIKADKAYQQFQKAEEIAQEIEKFPTHIEVTKKD